MIFTNKFIPYMKVVHRVLNGFNLVLLLVTVFIIGGCNKPDDMRPVIANLNVSLASIGKTVVITGKNFSPEAINNLVTFNGTPAVVSSVTGTTELTVTVPAGA